MKTTHKQKLIDLIHSTAYRHDTWTVYCDFLLMSATAICNSIDKTQFEQREPQYLQTVSKYKKDELDVFPQMLCALTLALQDCVEEKQPRDILGEVFHELNLNAQWKGQFFSPYNICNMMGSILADDAKKTIHKHGFFKLNEPTCGGGAMIFGLMTGLAKKNINYTKHMLVEAADIDLKCVHMAYLQLSLYGVPAVVYHRNSLTMETWSAWYTPIYILDCWRGRGRSRKDGDQACDDALRREESANMEETAEIPVIQIPLF